MVDPHLTLAVEGLVALAVGWTGDRSEERAHRLLDRVGGVRGLLAADGALLEGVGLSPSQATRLVALLELVRRREDDSLGMAITTPERVRSLLEPELLLATEERLVVLCLDRRHRLIAKVTVSVGSVCYVIVDAAQIYGIALRYRASAIILVHNHPSGDPLPSVQDVEVTAKVVHSGRVLGIPLLDHVIVASGGTTSLKTLGGW